MNNTKVGIITFHNAHNYGAVLQAYALHRKLELLGMQSEFIQDGADTVGNKYKLFPNFSKLSFIQYLKAWALLILDLRRKLKRQRAFNKFIDIRLPTRNLNKGVAAYESIALGSDQIWNFNITNGINDLYFGLDKNIDCNNIFSYAASMGNAMVEDNFTISYKDKLSKLDFIGVREKSLGEEIKNKFNLNYIQNVDPTLLLDKKEWDKLATSATRTESYILVYEVEKHSKTQTVVDFLRENEQLSIKVISSKTNHKVNNQFIATASPEEFLSLFKNAKYVVTSSFHGTVFSIINEIPFFTLMFNNGVDLRSAGLLNSLGLEHRHIKTIDDIDPNGLDIDFTDACFKLNKLREESIDYLKSSLANKK